MVSLLLSLLRVQDCFARYPNGSLLATTHLVLKEPCGDKYQSALSWNVPSVSEKLAVLYLSCDSHVIQVAL